MKAIRFHGQRDLRLDTVSLGPCGSDEVRIKVAFCGICGSDLHEYLAGPIFIPRKGEKHAYNGGEMPVTMGHEFSGVIVELGSNVASNLKLGMKVVVNPCIGDKQLGLDPCVSCRAGSPNTCTRFGFYGYSGLGGGLSEYIVAKAMNIFPLPDSVPLQAGALVEPLSVAWHCVEASGFKQGQDAVVLGAGPIGLALMLVLKAWNARTIIVSELLETRKEYARKFGADYVIDPTVKTIENGIETNPVVAKAKEVSGEVGGGAHVAFDATGIQETLNTAVASVRSGGMVFNVAIHERPLSVNLNDLTIPEKKLMGGMCFTERDISKVIGALANNTLAAEELITSIVPLEKGITGGFEELVKRRQHHVKVLIQPNVF